MGCMKFILNRHFTEFLPLFSSVYTVCLMESEVMSMYINQQSTILLQTHIFNEEL